MIDLNLDPSETRPDRTPSAKPGPSLNLKVVLFSVAGASALVGFGVAASTVMAGLAAPTPVKIIASRQAADWPELKDGLPAIKGSVQAAAAPAQPAKPETPALRMVSLPEAFAAITPAPTPPAPDAPRPAAPRPAKVAAAPVAPTQRIPVPTPVTPVAAAREVAPLAPGRTAALQTPRASETVRARELVEPAAPKPVAESTERAEKAERPEKKERAEKTERSGKSERTERAEKIERPEKPVPKAATRQTPAPTRTADKAKGAATATVAQAEPAEAEDTEVLGIKLPSLAPAGRKLKESVDALGDAVKNVF
ncbi:MULTISPECIES: hypothetical protein [Methylobacterium]|uniref:hypothetical protein n=1 Tax=Methylobacterium TaxID=407 RepID=UPI000344CDE8|nr:MULTISPECIES: hypothetical protein [Methylobacterium]MBN4093312.1 hypothetical protein [Methylobacterium sp. OT2]UIN34294.1 hypothetical protein LXM90_25000 [Methylobacterium oryzae]SEG15452.1 hypothetical protein SAMN04488144_11065 [Methylobacterium sp. 190mf]